MIYKEKYLKYKTKYLNLKDSIDGGANSIKILTWNVLASPVSNENTLYNIFKGDSSNVADFNVARESRIIDIIIGKLHEGTVICLQEINDNFYKKIIAALDKIKAKTKKDYFYNYGPGPPGPIQQGCLILSPVKLTNYETLYPSEGKLNNPIVFSEIAAVGFNVVIINTHMFAGGAASVTPVDDPYIDPFKLDPKDEKYKHQRNRQLSIIDNFIESNPREKKYIFCSDFNRYLINYPKLFTRELNLITSPIGPTNKFNVYIYAPWKGTEETLNILNGSIKDGIKAAGIEYDAGKHIITMEDMKSPAFKNNQLYPYINRTIIQERLYFEVPSMEGNCIDGIWTDIKCKHCFYFEKVQYSPHYIDEKHQYYPDPTLEFSQSDHLHVEVRILY